MTARTVAARGLLLAIFAGVAYMLGREWSANERPFWLDVVAFVLTFVIAVLIFLALTWALDNKDDPR